MPQLYPVGQHPAVGPAPLPDGHTDQPLAQVAAPDDGVAVAVVGTAVTGTTMVAPSETMVVEAVVGHEVVWQSRPVWQQPPP